MFHLVAFNFLRGIPLINTRDETINLNIYHKIFICTLFDKFLHCMLNSIIQYMVNDMKGTVICI